jgi:3-phenylpropionate/trans-cinnamate dioxygenase ferredoxin reductase component
VHNARTDIAIIGAGETGTRAALALRRLGFEGSITLVGADPHEPYELPPLSKDFITCEAPPQRKRIASQADFDAAKIEFHRATRVKSLDAIARSIELAGGGHLAFGQALIATGCSPRRLAIPGIAPEAVQVLRSAADAEALRAAFQPGKAIVVIGGGFIGLELASSAAKNGAMVTVIEGLDRVLKRGVPPEIAAIVSERHAAAGVAIHVNMSVTSGQTEGGRHHLTLSDGQTLQADCLVAGIGAIANTGLAEKAGLTVDNGIAVDRHFRTSDRAIFAAGDCVSYPHPVYGGQRLRLESWRAAVEHAAHVARAMMGEDITYETVPWFWSDQYDLTLQVAGLISEGTSTVRRDLAEGAFMLCHLNDEGCLVAASGIGPGDAVARDIRLAEMLIQRRAKPDPVSLSNPAITLKSLLKAA